MTEEKSVRFLFDSPEAKNFVYRPANYDGLEAQNATIGVKFVQDVRILDAWYLLGGSKWSRFKFRLKHPIVYSKRGLRILYRKIRRIFIKDRIVPCIMKDNK